MGRMKNRLPKEPSELFAFKNGKPVAVARPEDPAYILANMPKVGTPHEEAKEILDRLMYDHPHRFIGYASKKGTILDKWGREKEPHFQAGDSLIWRDDMELPMFMQSGKFHHEMWDGRKVLVLPRTDLKADSNTGLVLESPDRARQYHHASRLWPHRAGLPFANPQQIMDRRSRPPLEKRP